MNFRFFGRSFGLKPALAALAAFALTFGTAATANAQIDDLPSVAVIDFSVTVAGTDAAVGSQSAEALRGELASQVGDKFDVLARETVERVLDDLGLPQSPTQQSALMRVAQNLRVTNLMTGEVADVKYINVGDGRQAHILLKIQMRDVASGLVVNGADVIGSSPVRTSDVSNETLLAAAIDQAAFDAVREMAARQLPSATVLNTLRNSALINKGFRSGFRAGMEVVIVRGKEQVGAAKVGEVDPDSAFINFGELIKGVQPGDKVRTLYTPATPISHIGSNGTATKVRGSRGGSNSGLVSLLLVVLALAFLLGQGRSGSLDLASVTTEAFATGTDSAAVKISWKRDPFLLGNQEGPYRWQVWRNDGGLTPVAVADGTQSSVVDDELGTFHPSGSNPWYDFGGVVGGTECTFTDPGGSGAEGDGTLIVPGTPYQYSVEVMYRVSGLSLPGEGGGGGGGTGSEYCYFMSKRVNAIGIATPLVRSVLRSPDPDQVVTTPISFQFSSVRGLVQSVQLTYVIQLSTSPTFPNGNDTVTLPSFIELTEASGQTVSSPTYPVLDYFSPSVVDIYWRVGVRNDADKPGPVRDANGERFVYSAVRRFKRSGTPPFPPPAN